MSQQMPDFVPADASAGTTRSTPDSDAVPLADASTTDARDGGRRSRLVRNPVATFVAGGVLVAAAFVTVPAISAQAEAGSMAQLESLVSEYVAAVASGDVATATALAPVDGEYADASLLDVARPEQPASFDCEAATLLDDVATVSCAVSVARSGTGSSMRMRLVRDGAWRFETGLAVASPLETSVAVPRAIDGEALDSDVALGLEPVWLYPGAYELDAQVPAAFDATRDPLVVDGYGATWFGIGGPSAALQEEVGAAATDHVVACGDTGAVGCPEVTPLRDGERFEATYMGWGYSSADPRITADVAVARVGGAPDRWRVRVEVVVAADLESYELIATASLDTGEP